MIPDTDLPNGQISARLGVGGTAADPVLEPSLLAEVEVEGLRTPARVALRGHRRDDQISWVATVGEGQRRWLSTSGVASDQIASRLRAILGGEGAPSEASAWLSDVDGRVAFEDTPIDALARLAGTDVDVSGDLNGEVSVSGGVLRPVGRAAISWQGHLGDVAVKSSLRSEPVADGLDTSFDLMFLEEGSLHVGGRIPFTVDLSQEGGLVEHGALDLEVVGEGVPFAALTALSPDVVAPEGRLSMNGRVRSGHGPSDLRPEIGVSGTDLGFTYRPLGVRYVGMSLRADLNDERLRVEELALRTVPLARDLQTALQSGVQDSEIQRRPHLQITGEIRRREASEFDFEAEARNAWLMATDTLNLQADATIAVTGAWPNLNVSGPVNVVQGRVVLDTASLESAGPMSLDPVIHVVRAAPGLSEPVVEASPPIWAPFDFDLDVDLGRSIDVALALPFLDDLGALGAAVTRADLTARVSGDLDVRMSDQVPNLNGEVEVIEGAVRVVQARFDLNRGKFSFYGDDYTNPRMDVGGQMTLSDATIDLSMTGTPSQPKISFSSEEYPDETQIFTALLTGRPPEDLTTFQGVAAAQALGGLLVSSLLSGTQFGSFSIEPDGSVRLGLPVTRSIYAETIFQPIPQRQQNQITIHGEATILPRLVLSAAWGNVKSWADMFWEYRY